jgi:hypothetical protein
MTVNDDDEKPLDPAVERVRRKMVRLMGISIGIMMVGLMAVLFTIVYKIGSRPADKRSASVASDGSTSMPAPGYEGRIVLPAGAKILSSDLDGSNILLRLVFDDGREQLMVYSLGEDRVVANVAIE